MISKKKKAGIIAGSVVAAGIVVGGVTGGVLAATAKVTLKLQTQNAENNWINYKNTTIKKGHGAKLPDPPARAGYKFSGWYLDAANSVRVTDDTKFKKDTTLYAKWEANKYAIEFVNEKSKETGELSQTRSAEVERGANITVNNPSDASGNYEFLGWSEDANAKEAQYKVESGRNSITIPMPLYGAKYYAIWQAKNAISVKIGNDIVLNNKHLGDEVILPATVESAGFYGWKIRETLKDDGGNDVVKDIIYKPGQKIPLRKTMLKDANNIEITAEIDTSDASKLEREYREINGDKVDAIIKLTEDGITNPPSKAGYEFIGWYTSQEFTEEYRVTKLSDLDEYAGKKVVLWAKREAKTVKVSIKYGNAEKIDESMADPEPFYKQVGDTIEITKYVRNYVGYNVDFIGWSESTGREIDDIGVYKVPETDAEEIELTARWGSSFALLHFNLNGGDEWAEERPEYKETGDVDIPQSAPTRLGYDFVGWSIYPTGGEIIKAGEKFPLTIMTTLYAQWKAREFDIKYNLGTWYEGADITDKSSFGAVIDTSKVQEAVNRAREGYTFKGWQIKYATSNETVSVNANGTINITKDYITKDSREIEVKAIWTPNVYGFDIDGGAAGTTFDDINAAIDSIVFTDDAGVEHTNGVYGNSLAYGSVITLDAAKLAKEHYTLIGVVSSSAALQEDGAYGTEAERAEHAIVDGKIVLRVGVSGNMYKLNYVPDAVAIEYKLSATETIAAEHNTYYGAKGEATREVLEYKDVAGKADNSLANLKNAAGEYFSHWKVAGKDYVFFGDGIKSTGSERVIGNGSVNDLIANGKITLEAVYVAPTMATINFNLDGGKLETETEPITRTVDITNKESDINREHTFTFESLGIDKDKLAKTGYTFAGWNGDITKTSETIVNGEYSAPITITAEWTRDEYTVELHTWSDENTWSKTTTTWGKKILFNSTPQQIGRDDIGITPKAINGWTFMGWTTIQDSNIQLADLQITGDNIELTNGTAKRIDLYAVYHVSQNRTISFYANKGTGSTDIDPASMPANITKNILEGSELDRTVTIKEVPTRPGYTFTGFNTKADGTGASYAHSTESKLQIAVNENLNLFAQWRANEYSVKLGERTENMVFDTTELTPEDTASKGVGYKFVGWGYDAEKTLEADRYLNNAEETDKPKTFNAWMEENVKASAEKTIKLDASNVNKIGEATANTLTLHPVFVQEITRKITFNWGDGTTVEDADWINNYVAIYGTKEVSTSSAEVALPTELIGADAAVKVANAGYYISGFTVGESDATSVTIPFRSAGDIEVSAVWAPRTYTITIDDQNGSVVTDKNGEPITIVYNTTQTVGEILAGTDYAGVTEESPIMQREGYKFKGWHTSSGFNDYNNAWKESYSYTHTEAHDITLYAIWEAQGCNIEFSYGDNAPSEAVLQRYEVEEDSSLTLPNYQVWKSDETVSVAGKNFAGWKVTEIGTSDAKTRAATNVVENAIIYPGDTLQLEGTNITKLKLEAQYADWTYAAFNADGSFNTSWTGTELHIPLTLADGTTAPKLSSINNSQITLVTFPKGITSIAAGAINSSSVKHIVLPSSVTSLGAGAFTTNAMEKFAIGAQVELVGNPVKASGSTGVLAEYVINSANERYKTIDGGVIVGKTNKTLYAVPQTYAGALDLPVLDIENMALYATYGAHELTSVTLPSTKTEISDNEFQYCSSLATVNGLVNVTTIGASAFNGCRSLTDVTITNVTNIGASAFAESGLTSVEIPAGLAAIEDSTFSGCSSLANVAFAGKVVFGFSIRSRAFENCTSLKSITVPKNTEVIRQNAFAGCNSLESISLPFTGSGASGKSYYDMHEENCFFYIFGSKTSDVPASLKTVEITNSTSIATYAFNGCVNIENIKLNDDITQIYSYAFSYCPALKNITLPKKLERCTDSEFYGCSSLERITLPSSLLFISRNMFTDCTSLVDVIISNDATTSIGEQAFMGCTSLTSIALPNSLTNIQSSAFRNCTSLKSITIPNSVTRMYGDVFSGCSGLKEISLPFVGESNSATGNNAKFGYIFGASSYTGGTSTNQEGVYYYIPTKLTTVTITGGTSIGDSAFRYCSRLTSITIPEGVTSIGDNAFYNCNEVTSITIPSSVTSIGDSAFYACNKLTSITIPEGVTSIGNITFMHCRELTSITIPEGVTSIGNSAFYACNKLTSITIPSSVTSIGDSAFNGCSNLRPSSTENGLKYLGNSENPYLYLWEVESTDITSCVINAKCKLIGSPKFFNCSGLTSVTIPSSVTSIGSFAFNGCSNLQPSITENGAKYLGNSDNPYLYLWKATSTDITSCVINAKCKLIGSYAFDNCSVLTSITIPDSVTSIGMYAFSFCSGLTSITIPTSVTSIGSVAFSGCDGLTSITLEGDTLKAGNSFIFEGCNNLTAIYVKDELVESYKNAKHWSDYQDKFKPISEKPAE